jgi:hypothetical protein
LSGGRNPFLSKRIRLNIYPEKFTLAAKACDEKSPARAGPHSRRDFSVAVEFAISGNGGDVTAERDRLRFLGRELAGLLQIRS